MVVLSINEESLENTLTRLIADDLSLSRAEVTVEYIHRFRERNIYPTMVVDFTNKYGGLSASSDSFFSVPCISKLRESGERYLEGFRKSK
jgi:hypothetical protein